MNYIEVQQMRKQAADTFNTAVEKERQRRLAISKGDPRIEAAFDNATRRAAANAQAKRIADNKRYEDFRAEQRAQAQARANRVNATIAGQRQADAANKAKAMGVAPQPEPAANAATARKARINAANQRTALNTGKPTTGSGYMKLPNGQYASISNGRIMPIKNKQVPAFNTPQPNKPSAMRPNPAAIPQQKQRAIA